MWESSVPRDKSASLTATTLLNMSDISVLPPGWIFDTDKGLVGRASLNASSQRQQGEVSESEKPDSPTSQG
jgi:hypothetical protein